MEAADNFSCETHPPNEKCQLRNTTLMPHSDEDKSTTRQILIFEPDEELLKKHLVGRDVSPELSKFLLRLIKGKKWARKINIPASHENLAAALVFSSELKETGLEILSELHVFLDGVIIVEKWPVVGETDRISSLPKEAFTSIEIEKVRLARGRIVEVVIQMALADEKRKAVVRTFDFSSGESNTRIVSHPLLAE